MDIAPREPATAFNSPKIVEELLEVPLVQTTCSSIATMAAPLSLYLEVPVASIATGAATLKTKAEVSVLPYTPAIVTSGISSAPDVGSFCHSFHGRECAGVQWSLCRCATSTAT